MAWRRVVRIFLEFTLSFGPHEVFDANYEDANLEADSGENPLRLKVCVRLSGCSRIQNRRVVRKQQRRVKITPGIGFRVVRLLLKSSNLLSIDPGTFSDACLLGGGECLHNANNWPICMTTTREQLHLYLPFVHDLRISSAFLPIQVNLFFSRHFHLHSACLWES